MIDERLGSPDEFAGALAAHLAGHDLPDGRDLRALVEIAFFASLNEEEGQKLAFAIAWMSRASACRAVFEIARPVLATPKNVAKLAPATSGEVTALAVRREGADLVVWALFQQSQAHEQPLTIRALAPGVLRVELAGIPRALYTRGEILLLGGAHDVKSSARRLTAAFARWSGAADAATRVDARAAIVTRIAARALEHGHGGMILIIPAEAREPEGVRVHYEVGEGSDVLARRYADLVSSVPEGERLARIAASRARAADGHAHVLDEAQLRAAEAVAFVARLTAIDNALLLDTDLRVRGFGVQVIEADAPQRTFTHVSPYSEDVHVDDLSTFKGTRHPAGVIFCLRQPGEAAAVIASQDGRLSLAVKDARGVVEVLGSYERAFGWR
ncbi:MAG: putative sensor domain DACNV-containing protein [Byssovorax sp.]